MSFISEYPTPHRVSKFLTESLEGEDVVFVTYLNSVCYGGKECLTPRLISMMEAMQVSNRISTVLHFGNPYVVEDLPHISRVVIGCASERGVEAGLDVLAGKSGANGVLTYDIQFR